MQTKRSPLRRGLGPLAVLAVTVAAISVQADWVHHPWGAWVPAPVGFLGSSSGTCPVDSRFSGATAEVSMFNHVNAPDAWNSWFEYGNTSAAYCPHMKLRLQCKGASGHTNTQTFASEWVSSSNWAGPNHYCPVTYPNMHRARCHTSNLK